MKRNWLAAFFGAFSIVFELIVDPVKDFLWQEKEILHGAEDDDDDTEQGIEKTDS